MQTEQVGVVTSTPTVPKLVCAWCQTEEERRNQPPNQSHGICAPCSAKALADYFERKRQGGRDEN